MVRREINNLSNYKCGAAQAMIVHAAQHANICKYMQIYCAGYNVSLTGSSEASYTPTSNSVISPQIVHTHLIKCAK